MNQVEPDPLRVPGLLGSGDRPGMPHGVGDIRQDFLGRVRDCDGTLRAGRHIISGDTAEGHGAPPHACTGRSSSSQYIPSRR